MQIYLKHGRSIAGTSVILALAGCVVAPPSGPTVMALPKQGTTFEAFKADDAACRGYAYEAGGGVAPAQAASNAAVGSAVVGTAIGAVTGAALGSLGHAAGAGAVVGGATGLLVGSSVGANNAQATVAISQREFDTRYAQCMMANGYTVQAPPPAPVAYYGAPYAYPYGYAYQPAFTIGVGGYWGPDHGWRHW